MRRPSLSLARALPKALIIAALAASVAVAHETGERAAGKRAEGGKSDRKSVV